MALYEAEGKENHIGLMINDCDGKEIECTIPVIYGSSDDSKSDQKVRNMTIYKYPLRFLNNKCCISLPDGYKIVHLKAIDDIPYIWCIVNKNKDKRMHEFIAYGTGHEIDEINANSYVGTYQIADGRHTYHVFQSNQYRIVA